jgi:hypothetical protein
MGLWRRHFVRFYNLIACKSLVRCSFDKAFDRNAVCNQLGMYAAASLRHSCKGTQCRKCQSNMFLVDFAYIVIYATQWLTYIKVLIKSQSVVAFIFLKYTCVLIYDNGTAMYINN